MDKPTVYVLVFEPGLEWAPDGFQKALGVFDSAQKAWDYAESYMGWTPKKMRRWDIRGKAQILRYTTHTGADWVFRIDVVPYHATV